MPLSDIPYSGVLICSQHDGQRGFDARFVFIMLGLTSAPVGVVTSAVILFSIICSSKLHILHMRLLLCISGGELFWQLHYFISSLRDFLRDTGPATPLSLESTLVIWLGHFGYIFGFFWHTAMITSVFLMARFPVLFRKPSFQKFLFVAFSIIVWSLSLLIAGFQYFTNSVRFKQGFSLETSSWGAQLIAIFYTLGLLWAVFVIIYSVRKLGLRLMGIGQAGRTKSVVFLMAVVIMYYAPNLLPVILFEVSICQQTAVVGALQLVHSLVPVSTALCTFLVWRRYAVFTLKEMPSIPAKKFSASRNSQSQTMGLSNSQSQLLSEGFRGDRF
jgi:hypothetical protein